MTIKIQHYHDSVRLGADLYSLADGINELAERGWRAEVVRCRTLHSGLALVFYSGAPEGDGVFTGAELAAELEAALLAKVEGR